MLLINRKSSIRNEIVKKPSLNIFVTNVQCHDVIMFSEHFPKVKSRII